MFACPWMRVNDLSKSALQSDHCFGYKSSSLHPTLNVQSFKTPCVAARAYEDPELAAAMVKKTKQTLNTLVPNLLRKR